MVTRRPTLVFAASFVSLLTLLLIRNSRIFTLAVHERGDAAANSIIIDQARHFELLVGNYSRLGFSHPGPAFFYWQALGEWLCHDVLRLVPAPWNGQWLALLVLNSALVALILTILHSWSASWPPVAWAGAAALLFYATHDNLLSSTWMPYLYIAPFLLLLTAATSVAAGRTDHLWALALAGGLLVHGHVEFLLFVPAIAGYALAVLWYTHWRGPYQPQGGGHRAWLAGAVVVAVFLFPMVLNLALHWPGEFGRYLGYGHSRSLHGAGATTRYLLGFWAGRPAAAVALAVVLFAAVAGLAALYPPGRPRRFLTAGLGLAGLVTVLFAGYTARGIDDLHQRYVGYFYRAVPLFLLLLAVLGVTGGLTPGRAAQGYASRRTPRARLIRLLVQARTVRLPVFLRTIRMPGRVRAIRLSVLWAGRPGDAQPTVRRRAAGWVLTGAALGTAFGVAGLSPSLATAPDHAPGVSRALAAAAGYTGGRPVLVELEQGSWPALTALIIEGDRTGQRVCARDPAWRFLVTGEFVCTGRDLAEGRTVRLGAHLATGGAALAELDGSVLCATDPRR